MQSLDERATSEVTTEDRLRIVPAEQDPKLYRLDKRFGGFVDVALGRRGLFVDEVTKQRLLPLVASAISEATQVNLSKSLGDYSDTGETAKYPAFEPAEGSSSGTAKRAGKSLTFGAIIEEEQRRRSLGKESKPVPSRTIRKFQNASNEFADFRGSEDARTVTAHEVEGWKLHMLEEGELSNNTIGQRMQNARTVLEWGQQHELGGLFQGQNLFDVVKRPEKRGVRSEDRTLRLTSGETARRLLVFLLADGDVSATSLKACPMLWGDASGLN